MAKKAVFQPLIRDAAKVGGVRGEPIPYSPLMVIVGSEAHKLALHKNPHGHWVVSDPKSGAKVCDVNGQYKGIRVSSKGLSLRDIRQLALADADTIAQRVGPDRFNEVLKNPKPF